jgi:hypothetical protein
MNDKPLKNRAPSRARIVPDGGLNDVDVDAPPFWVAHGDSGVLVLVSNPISRRHQRLTGHAVAHDRLFAHRCRSLGSLDHPAMESAA